LIKFIKKIWNKIFNKTKSTPTVASSSKIVPVGGVTVIDLNKETNPLDVDLVDNNASEKDNKAIRTFTKKWVDIILTVALIDVQLVFVLAFLGKTQIAETLGVAIVTEIVGIGLGYMAKSYFESYSSEKNKLEIEKMNNTYQVQTQPIEPIDTESESVG